MKRFHVHVGVTDLDASIRFYSALFGIEPSMSKDDYAKWMLDDPRVNFAISTRGGHQGLDHLGIQAETGEELNELRQRISASELPLASQANTTCCYANSNKHWTRDPQDIAWETFHTLGDAPVIGDRSPASSDIKPALEISAEGAAAAACCIPLAKAEDNAGSCCVPLERTAKKSSCCS